MKIERMTIDVTFEVEPVALGAVFSEQVLIREVVMLRTHSEGDAIVITSEVPVSTSDDALSIGGSY